MGAFRPGDSMSEVNFDAMITAQPNLSSANWTGTKPDLDQSNFDTISLAGGKWFVDKIRVGTTFGDLTSVPVPEPSTLALVVMGSRGLLRRRRTA